MIGNNLVLYRLPGNSQYVRLCLSGNSPEVLADFPSLSGRKGFVFAPFRVTDETPILLYGIENAVVADVPDTDDAFFGTYRRIDQTAEKQSYSEMFRRFHQRLTNNYFGKIVLARNSDYVAVQPDAAEHLFFRACRCYPDAYVALVSTPNHGTWLMSTPELLLSVDGQIGQTMALAGTIPTSEKPVWSAKNKEEQQIVARYIGDILAPFVREMTISEPHTIRAGKVMHLQTDFRFTLNEQTAIGALLQELHPTPAVCGIPKTEAQQFIIENETVSRLYYSGFSGLLNMKGHTSLYVSLRCMQITDEGLCLYAGGGLLRESELESEWRETEAKMATMRQLFEHRV